MRSINSQSARSVALLPSTPPSVVRLSDFEVVSASSSARSSSSPENAADLISVLLQGFNIHSFDISLHGDLEGSAATQFSITMTGDNASSSRSSP